MKLGRFACGRRIGERSFLLFGVDEPRQILPLVRIGANMFGAYHDLSCHMGRYEAQCALLGDTCSSLPLPVSAGAARRRCEQIGPNL